MKRWWVLIWLVATVLVVLAVMRIDGLRDALTTVQPAWLVLAMLCNLGILVLWTRLWRALLPRAEHKQDRAMFETVAITAMTMNTAPFMSGHAAAIGFLTRRARITSAGAAAVLSTHEVLEGSAKVAIMLAAIALTAVPKTAISAVLTLVIVVLAVSVALALFARKHAGTSWLSRWSKSLEVLRDGRRFIQCLALMFGMKAFEMAGIWFVQQSFGLDLPLHTMPLIMSGVLLGTMFALAPGNVGTYEAGVLAAYQQAGLPAGTALAVAIVQHACLLVALVGPGYLLLTLEVAAPQQTRFAPLRVLQAGAIWLVLLGFTAVIGVLALFRNFDRRGAGSGWAGIRATDAEIKTHLARIRSSAR